MVDAKVLGPRAIADIGHIPLSVASSLRLQHPCYTSTEARTMIVQYLEALSQHLPEALKVIAYVQNIYPVLPAWEDGFTYLHVYCQWCREWHHHGNGEGGRVPHCEWQSPWMEIGDYTLQRVGAYDTEAQALAPRIRFPMPTAGTVAP